jgi:N-acetylglutamate synthase-like GNAT family acetyltransferase
MNSSSLRARRATVEDLAALKTIWLSMRLPADALENRLTEFQVVERESEVVGAIGLQILRTAALLHSEGYSDFGIADSARQLFWERIQTLAASHGVFRLWTLENSPFWLRWGFQPADADALARLPDEWKNPDVKWFTLELKNEAVINAALQSQFAGHRAAEKKSTEETLARAKVITNTITVICFLIFGICLVVAGWLFMHRRH